VSCPTARDILGLWVENTEDAKFWIKVFNDLKTRGVGDSVFGRVSRPPEPRRPMSPNQ
jgi:hypothetical protein